MALAELKALTNQLIEKDMEIRLAKEEWEYTFDAVLDLILVLDTNFIIKRCNRAFLHFFDATEDMVLGKTCYEFIHGDDGPIDGCPYVVSMDSCEPSKLTAKLHNHHFEITCTPVIDSNGEISGIVHLMHDVTELQIANDSLTETNISLEAHTQELMASMAMLQEQLDQIEYQRQLLRSMCDNVLDLIWAKDLNKRYIFANTSICTKLLNASDTNEPIGKDDMFFAARERLAHANNYVWHTFGEMCQNSDDNILNTLKPQKFNEYGNVRGQYLELDVYKAPLYVNDALVGIVGSARDITYENHLKNELDRQINFIDCLTTSLPVPIAYLTLDGIYLDCNAAFSHFYGMTRSNIIGKARHDLYPEDAAFFDDLDRRLITGEDTTPQRIFHTMYDKDFIPHSVILIRTLHHDGEGNPIGILVVSVGIPHTALPDLYKDTDTKASPNAGAKNAGNKS